MAEFDEIMKAARRAVEWGTNLILTPAELDVMLLEFARLKIMENRLKALVMEKARDLQNKSYGRQN